MDLSTSVIIPREDFLELQEVAYDNKYPVSIADRAANTAQTIVVVGGLGTIAVAVVWGFTRITDKLDERRYKRERALVELAHKNEVELIQKRRSPTDPGRGMPTK